MKALSAGLILLGLLPALPLAAASVESSRIEAVTVYPDRATVKRVILARVAAGDHALRIEGLPAGLDADTLRVAASGPAGLRLGQVETRRVRGADRVLPAARELEEALAAAERDRRRVELGLEALDLEMEFLRSLTRREESHIEVDEWARAAGSLGERATDIHARRLQAEDEARELDQEIERLKRRLEDLGRQQRDTLEVSVAYASRSAGRAEIELEYTVGGVGWETLYELRLDTADGRLEVVRAARVRQNSGEDWSDVELVLSLSRPALGGRLPELRPWFIDLVRPEPQPRELARMHADAVAAPEVMAEAAAFEGGDFAAAFRVPGRVSVAGDNQPHRFGLTSDALEAALSARVVPRRSLNAYLYAESSWSGDGVLLPGRASLFQDGARVGEVRIGPIAPGGELALAFGVADGIEVDYTLTRDTRGTSGMVRRAQHREREYVIEVKNGYRREMDILVLDQMPVPRDERIQVELTRESDPPTVRDLDDRPGIVGWRHTYAPDQSRRIRFGYRATWPDGEPDLAGW